MTYLLVWPAVFAIPSCFHCCLSADFISYQNVFVCFVDGIWTSLRIIQSLDVLLSHLSYEDQMKGQGTKQERSEIHSLCSKHFRVISELRMTEE